MRGQLWQECYCGTEPVCAQCECCARHCTCAQEAEDARQLRAFDQKYPGVRRAVEEHHEQSAAEH